MKKIVKSITVQVKYIPLKTPFINALKRVDTIEFVRLTLMCEDLSVGVGEAPAGVRFYLLSP